MSLQVWQFLRSESYKSFPIVNNDSYDQCDQMGSVRIFQ